MLCRSGFACESVECEAPRLAGIPKGHMSPHTHCNSSIIKQTHAKDANSAMCLLVFVNEYLCVLRISAVILLFEAGYYRRGGLAG
jgi:hypothetical protein